MSVFFHYLLKNKWLPVNVLPLSAKIKLLYTALELSGNLREGRRFYRSFIIQGLWSVLYNRAGQYGCVIALSLITARSFEQTLLWEQNRVTPCPLPYTFLARYTHILLLKSHQREQTKRWSVLKKTSK